MQTQKSHYVDYTIFYKQTFCKLSLSLIILLGISATSLAQDKSQSPYSRYGIGELKAGSFSFNRSIANSGIASYSTYSFNDANVANLSFLKQPVFEVLAQYQSTEFSNTTSSATNTRTSFEGFALALPFRKLGGVSLGITPYSGVGYSFTDNRIIDDSTSVEYNYNGTGGLNKGFAGLTKGKSWFGDSLIVSLGVKADFIFGNITRESTTTYTGDYFVDAEQTSVSSLRNMQFSLGGIAKWQPTGSTTIYSVGAQYTLGTNLKGSQEFATRTFLPIIGGSKNYKDTVVYVKDENIKVSLPSIFKVGATVALKEKLQFSVAYETQSWDSFKQDGNQEKFIGTLQNSTRTSVGALYQPKRISVFRAPVWQIAQYKLGAYSSSGYLNINGQAVERSGINFGLSLPLSKSNSNSRIHFSGEYGVQGTTDNNLIKEKYYSIYFGLSLTPNFVDRWFVKRKYD